MPHLIIDCSSDVLEVYAPERIMAVVHGAAKASNLFAPENIKVRIQPYPASHWYQGDTEGSFMHVFGHIMGGRTPAQKKMLSESVMKALKELCQEVPIISMNVIDFDPSTYTNRNSIS